MVLVAAFDPVLHARFILPWNIRDPVPGLEPPVASTGRGRDMDPAHRKDSVLAYVGSAAPRAPCWIAAWSPGIVTPVMRRGPCWRAPECPEGIHAQAIDYAIQSLLPGEHATEHGSSRAVSTPFCQLPRPSGSEAMGRRWYYAGARPPNCATPSSGRWRRCPLDVSERQRSDLEAWLRARGLSAAPLI